MNGASDGRTYEEVSGEYVAMTDQQKASPEGQVLGFWHARRAREPAEHPLARADVQTA